MTVPALPASQSSGGTAGVSWANGVRSLLGYLRDDRPAFKGVATDGSTTPASLSTGSLADWGFGAAGVFNPAPTVNIGGWLPDAASATPEPLAVPETGIYVVTVTALFDTNTSGRRAVVVRKNGGTVSDAQMVAAPATGGGTHISVSTVEPFSAGDLLNVGVFQSSGVSLSTTAWLSAYWVVDT